MAKPENHLARVALAKTSLVGLSVGDAFGEGFFVNPTVVEGLIDQRALPRAPWRFTDDTVMGVSVFDVLCAEGDIDQDALAKLFASRYRLDPGRGYGPSAHGILLRIADGEDWRIVSSGAFGGMGSMGNGGAMRAGPIGAYFFDDFHYAALAAKRSAEVTHAHGEGQAGAIAVAVATAWATHGGGEPADMFQIVLDFLPASDTRAGVERAATLPLQYDVRTAVFALGNGNRVIAQDTVPFALWCAARHLGNFEEALWTTVAGLGDRDTTCAIVGSIVAASKEVSIPTSWVEALEPLSNVDREIGHRT